MRIWHVCNPQIQICNPTAETSHLVTVLSLATRPSSLFFLLSRTTSFCGGGVSSAFEIGGIGEPLKIFTLSFEHTLTTCWIHIKLRCHLAALVEFRAQFAIRQN